MIPFFSCYFMLAIQGFRTLNVSNFKPIDFVVVFSVITIVSFLFYEIIEMIAANDTTMYHFLLIYDSIIVLAVIPSVCNMYNTMNLKNTLLMIAILAFIFSDIFYALNNYYFKFAFLFLFSYPLQMLCYVLLVKYFLMIEKEKELTQQ